MFRRKSRSQPDDLATDEPDAEEPSGPAGGPWDVDDLPDDGVDRIDVGSLLVPPVEGTEIRLQVDDFFHRIGQSADHRGFAFE